MIVLSRTVIIGTRLLMAALAAFGALHGGYAALACGGLCSGTYMFAPNQFVAGTAVLSLFLGPMIAIGGAIALGVGRRTGAFLVLLGGVAMGYAFGPANTEQFYGAALPTVVAGVLSAILPISAEKP